MTDQTTPQDDREPTISDLLKRIDELEARLTPEDPRKVLNEALRQQFLAERDKNTITVNLRGE